MEKVAPLVLYNIISSMLKGCAPRASHISVKETSISRLIPTMPNAVYEIVASSFSGISRVMRNPITGTKMKK